MQIGQFDDFYETDYLVIIAFGVLTGLTYSSVSPKAGLAVATSQNPMLYTTIGQSILLETAFPAEIDVATPITQCFIQLLDSLFYLKLHFQLKLT